jgi:hypothetical protein
MILIAGDSWGCGEWPRGDLANKRNLATDVVLHGGLGKYLQDAGTEVVNISVPAGSNFGTARAIEAYLSRFGSNSVECVYAFQTEYTRDYWFKFDEDYANTEFSAYSGIFISRFYSMLSRLAKEYNVKIKLIGGCSDTLWFDDIDDCYPGIEIVCQSITNLVVNNTHRIEVPVLSWYSANSINFITEVKRAIKHAELINLEAAINLGFEREALLAQYPEYFFPDGVHANRLGHKILFEFLYS